MPIFCRLRLTPFRKGALCRSCNCLRGCLVSLTQGPQRLFPRFAPGLARLGRTAVLPPVNTPSSPHGASQARSAGREESPCVHASSLLSALQSKRKISATTKKSFSLLDRARPAKVSREAARGPSGGFSLFLRSEKEKMGGASRTAKPCTPVPARGGNPLVPRRPPPL